MPSLLISIGLTKDIIALPNLTIPSYQRPYTWKIKNALQLLDDVRTASTKSLDNYRIGTIIFHKDTNENLNIVDGQQRLTTMSLIFYALKDLTPTLLMGEYSHDDSKANLIANYTAIVQWLYSMDDNAQQALKAYLLYHCEFVTIQLDDLSEAFQFFDSQNSRGKSLEPADLLKAFHLREMSDNTESEKIACVKTWEDAIDQGNLNYVIGTYLFRIRKWAQGDNAYTFTKNDIEEFKGVNFDRFPKYPYLRAYLMNDAVTAQFEKDLVWNKLGNHMGFPFQMTQMIINGKRFFEMIEHYVKIHQELFDKKTSTAFSNFYKKHTCYPHSNRSGDLYVRNLFKAITMFYYDRFGSEGFEQTYPYLYMWAYKLRLDKFSVRYSSIDAHIQADGNNLFKMLNSTYDHRAVLNIRTKLSLTGNTPERPIAEIIEVFKTYQLN
ncbi:DUF262 domain-containing protein [Mucilaginibacter jinjuensis]|uniref:DUF262 domain-containing protein n=1 Tax=Mucilaginibacter jinjuensis TaxID=1176721 RepID=A0ABY7TBA2_9SPHI|nr:DUF262 domain-containing protein [Mucilaginibacter jinjuensis]WCT13790.1 DUF262 domain-containing protein [Mucilaginibacter jinjuensis]